jgi:hypothetical protein
MPLIRRRTDGESTRPVWPRRPRAALARVDLSFGDPRLAALREAAAAGRWPEIRALLDGAVHSGDCEELTWLVEGLMMVAGSERWLGEVTRAEPRDPLALLVSGARHVEWAWEARTRQRAQNVSREQFEVFHARLRAAEDLLYEVAEAVPEWVAPWYFLQISGRGLQVGPQVAARRFEASVRRCPAHLAAHRQHLQQICRKWGGSHEEMHAFAREAMLAVPPGGTLGELVAVAHLEHWLDLQDDSADMEGGRGTEYLRGADVIVSLYEAAERSVHHPDYPRRRDWTRGFNTFAMAFALAGEREAAADLFRVLDGSVTEFPWMYLDGRDPAAPFRGWRVLVGA